MVCSVTKHCNTHPRPLTTQMLIPHIADTCNSSSRDRVCALRNMQHPSESLWRPRCDPPHHRYINSSSRDRCAALRNIATPSEASDDQMLIPHTTDTCNSRLSRDRVRRYETLQHPSEASDDPDVDPHIAIHVIELKRSVCGVTKHCNTHPRPLTTQMLIPHTTDTCNSSSRDRVARYETLQHPSEASDDPDVDP